jgi:hypothetical protein
VFADNDRILEHSLSEPLSDLVLWDIDHTLIWTRGLGRKLFAAAFGVKKSADPDVLPPADAMLVAPAILNSLSKWALGVAGTLALGLITEGIGLGLPIVALPYLNAAQCRHLALAAHVCALEAVGVTVLLGDDGHQPHPLRSGVAEQFLWSAGLTCLAAD